MSVDETTSKALDTLQEAIPINSHLPYELLKQIFDTMNEALAIGDKDGKAVFINNSFTKIFGYQPEEILGKKIVDFLDTANRKFFTEQRDKRKKTLNDPYELSVTCKDGQQLPAMISPVALYDDDNNFIGSFGIFTDILERKLAETELMLEQQSLEGALKNRTEEWADIKEQLKQKKAEHHTSNVALEKNRSLFAQMTNSLEVAFWICNLQCDQMLYISPAYEKIWGRPVEDVYKNPQNWIDTIHPEDKQRVVEAARNMTSVGIYDQEYRVFHTDGSMKWLRGHGYPVCDENGELLHCAGYIEDITDKKQAELKLAEKHKQVQMLSSQMTSIEEHERKVIAEGLHDTIIQPMIFLDIKLGSLASTQRDDEIIQEYKQMRQILAELIEKTRSFTFDLSNPVLYELGLETALEEWLSTEIEAKHKLPVVFKASEGLDKLSDDVSVFVLKAVKELMTNIVKHANAKSAFISVVRDDTGIEVCIKDNGKGFDLDDKSGKHVKSSGLGLFSLKERLVYLGGCFDIKSESGNGTIVNIRIPISEAGS